MRFFTILALAGMSIAHAATVWDNGSPNGSTVLVSDSDSTSHGQDDFTLTSTTTLRSLTWWGVYSPSAAVADSFTVEFWDNVGLLNSFALTAERGSTSMSILSLPVYVYTADILPDLTLNAGTYFIRIFNNTSGDPATWFWAGSSGTGNATSYPIGGGSPLLNLGELAFQLSDTAVVPEPATYLLSALGLAGIFLARRRA